MFGNIVKLTQGVIHQGIPEQADVPPVAQVPAGRQAAAINPPVQDSQPAAVPTSGPNANPLDLFPQEVGTNL